MRFTIPKDATDAEVVALIRQAAAVQKIRKHAAPIHPSGSDQSVHAGKDKKKPKKQYRYTITDLPQSKASAAYEGEVHARGCSHIKRGKAGRAVANVTSFDPEKAVIRWTRKLDQDWGPEQYRVMSCTASAPEAILQGGKIVSGPPRSQLQKAAARIAKANFTPTVTVDHIDRNLVFGWANIAFTKDGTQVSDLQGHTIDMDDLEEAAYDFAIRFRKSGGMHKTGPWGEMVESFVATPEKLEALGIPPGTLPQGWWVGFRVPPEEFRKVKAGDWKMFSIQGKAQLEPIDDEPVEKHAQGQHDQKDHGNWARGTKKGSVALLTLETAMPAAAPTHFARRWTLRDIKTGQQLMVVGPGHLSPKQALDRLGKSWVRDDSLYPDSTPSWWEFVDDDFAVRKI